MRRDERAGFSTRGVVLQGDLDFRAPIGGRRSEVHGAFVLDVAAGQRTPQQSARPGVPPQSRHPTRPADLPAPLRSSGTGRSRSTRTSCRWCMKRGKFSSCRQKSYTALGGRLIVTLLLTRTMSSSLLVRRLLRPRRASGAPRRSRDRPPCGRPSHHQCRSSCIESPLPAAKPRGYQADQRRAQVRRETFHGDSKAGALVGARGREIVPWTASGASRSSGRRPREFVTGLAVGVDHPLAELLPFNVRRVFCREAAAFDLGHSVHRCGNGCTSRRRQV